MWFWSRDDSTTPKGILYGSSEMAVDGSWGWPEAAFKFEDCDYASHFDAHQILFDLTFCVNTFS